MGGLSDTKDLTAEEQEILSQKKESTVYSLTLFQQMLKNMREKEGTTWDDDEKEFNEMLKFVRDALSSLERHTPNAEELEKNIISPLKTKWRKFQSENISTGNRGSDQIFSEIFSHDKNTIIKGMRKL
ncbi:MAG: hypothetical protein LBD11_00165 [Candidatus Peribacteria bacterium]|nr:hypothetical protein [Candidatus Peribacteria bacterium]